MARPRAADHDAKRRTILEHATSLFAERGYARTSMADIAESCGSSKALLYHYYENKEQLLYDILLDHFERIERAVAAADVAGLDARQRLRALIGALLDAYEGADATHKVQVNDLGLLPAERQEELKDYERHLVRRFGSALAAVHPALARKRALLKPVTMSLFGMVNWSYLWFRSDGPMSRAQYADLVTQIMIDGTARVGQVAPVASAQAKRVAAR